MAYLFDTDAIAEVFKPRPAAGVFGQVRAQLESAGRPLADADLQIAATALLHDLELVTGNLKHFSRVPALRISPALAGGRARS